MSSITKDTVKKMANLTRIQVSDEQAEKMVAEFENILGFVEQLSELDTTGVAPLANVVGGQSPLREDKVTDGGYPEAILANAPEAVQGFFAVPKVVE